MERLKSYVITFLKGIASPIITMIVFALTIGLFLSLTLLVISIEEGTGNFSDSAMSITCATLMLAQGVGLGFDGFILTIIPLGLTFLLIAFMSWLISRFKGRIPVYIIGLVCWIILNGIISRNTSIELLDSLPILLVKSSVIYIISLLFAVIPNSKIMNFVKDWIKKYIPSIACKAIRLSVIGTLAVVIVYAVVSCVFIVLFSVLGAENVESYFVTLDMQQGSRILTTIACLAWLPNVVLWILSWICGAGFSFGSVASFALNHASYKQIPPVPVFGIFPHAVTGNLQQLLILGAIPASMFICALFILFLKNGCNIRLRCSSNKIDYKQTFIDFSFSAVCLVAIASCTTIVMTIIFNCCNGSLGQYRLKNVGVNIIESVHAVGQSTLLPFISAWLVSLIGIVLLCLIRLLLDFIKNKYFPHKDDNKINSSASDEEKTIISSSSNTSEKSSSGSNSSNSSNSLSSSSNSSSSSSLSNANSSNSSSNTNSSSSSSNTNSSFKSRENNNEDASKESSDNPPLSSKHNVPRTVRSKTVKE